MGTRFRTGVLIGEVLGRGEWIHLPAMSRLRLTGTGSCTIDARDSLGTISLAVESFVAVDATDQIEFPFPGNNAREVRFNFTGSCKGEII